MTQRDMSMCELERTADLKSLPNHEKIQELLEASIAENTRRAYTSRLIGFISWCQNVQRSFLPADPETLLAYLAYLGQNRRSSSTVDQTLAAIKLFHESHNFESPTDNVLVRKARTGYRRVYGTRSRKKAAITDDLLRQIVHAAGNGKSDDRHRLVYLRDMALLLIGFAGAFRRSELVNLDVEDLEWRFQGEKTVLLVNVGKSKADQEGQGMMKAIFPAEDKSCCPIEFLKAWMTEAKIVSGAVFRRFVRGNRVSDKRLSDQSVACIVKKYALAADLAVDVAGHSLRSGFVTSAIRHGKGERSIMNQTGHCSVATLRGYYQRESAVEDNAAENLL